MQLRIVAWPGSMKSRAILKMALETLEFFRLDHMRQGISEVICFS